MSLPRPLYAAQDSAQTLQEALAEYYALNPHLLDPGDMPVDAADLFERHDVTHVVFGCDTSLRGETLVDTWTIFGTTAGLSGYLQYFKYPQVNAIFAEVGSWAMARWSAPATRATPIDCSSSRIPIGSRRSAMRSSTVSRLDEGAPARVVTQVRPFAFVRATG